MAKTKAPKNLTDQMIEVPGRISTLRVAAYHDIPVYIRQIDEEIFEYLLSYNSEIYSAYIIMKPEEGKKKLTQKQLKAVIQVITAGAHSTIEYLLGLDPTGNTALAEIVDKQGGKVFAGDKN